MTAEEYLNSRLESDPNWEGRMWSEDTAREYARLKSQEDNAELVEALKKMLPFADDAKKLYHKNGVHQEFLREDDEFISHVNSLIAKHSK